MSMERGKRDVENYTEHNQLSFEIGEMTTQMMW